MGAFGFGGCSRAAAGLRQSDARARSEQPRKSLPASDNHRTISMPRAAGRQILRRRADHRLSLFDRPVPTHGNQPFGHAALLFDFIVLPAKVIFIVEIFLKFYVETVAGVAHKLN